MTDGKAKNGRLVYQITCKIYLFKDARSHQSNPVRSSLEVMILLSSHDSMFPSASKPNLPFKDHCILCNEIIYVSNKRNKSTAEIRKEFTIPDNILAESLKKHLSKVAHERNDYWGAEVLGRLELVHDLVASESVYHVRCITNFDNMTR